MQKSYVGLAYMISLELLECVFEPLEISFKKMYTLYNYDIAN